MWWEGATDDMADVRLTSRVLVVLTAVLFSTGGAAIKATTLSGWQVASFRSGVAAVALLLLVPASRRGWSRRTLMVGATYAVTMILFVQANKLTTAANSIFLQSTAPLYMMLLGPWLLKEVIRRRDMLFMVALAVGLALFFVGAEAPRVSAPDPVLGNLLGAATSVFWALTLVGLRALGRNSREGESPAAAAAVAGNAMAFLVALPFALPARGTPADWGLIAFLGIVQIGLAYALLTSAVRHVPVFEVSLLLLVEPVLSPIWAWMVHAEVPGGWSLAACGLILTATVIKTWTDALRLSRAR
jgi:drug/metabolite transporter (DMT)-like permease